jgi:hypothetical protein
MSKFMLRTITVLFILSVSTVAFGQATRTWVSGVGDDVNPCSRTAPCKTFAGAISKTANNGEINAIDSGGFGAVTITKNITIDGAGVQASILSAGVTGVTISSAAPVGVRVILRNLSINGAFVTTGAGVRMLQGGTLTIEHCYIFGYSGTAGVNGVAGRGISIETPSNTKVDIRNTEVRHNNQGLVAVPTGGGVSMSVDSSTFINNTMEGFKATGLVFANLARSNFSLNGTAGVLAENNGADVSLLACQVHRNANGVVTQGTATAFLKLGASSITQNTTNGILVTSGQVISHGNNMISGNVGNQTPSANILTQ